jgi:hypothetical protein
MTKQHNGMSDDAERIRRQMQHVRQDMGADVQGIVRGARELIDWRRYVRLHPWACVAGAFALGFLASPARKRMHSASADMDRLIAQLKSRGLAAATGAAPLYPGGAAGKLLAVAGPLLAKSVINIVAQRLARGPSPDSHPAASHPDPPWTP